MGSKIALQLNVHQVRVYKRLDTSRQHNLVPDATDVAWAYLQGLYSVLPILITDCFVHWSLDARFHGWLVILNFDKLASQLIMNVFGQFITVLAPPSA